jgi:hypothetical protein
MMKNDLLDVNRDNQKFYGIYRAVVEEDNPKVDGVFLKDGRIRVRVWGLHNVDKEEIPVKDLPLAQPAYPNMIGSISGKGVWSVPLQGTHMFIFFENGDHMEPRYFATAPGIEPTEGDFDRGKSGTEGFRDPDGTYPLATLMDEPDMNRLMWSDEDNPVGTAWEDIKDKLVEGGCPAVIAPLTWDPGPRGKSYPNNFVLETKTGQTLEMNDTTNLLYQGDNSYIVMDNSKTYIKGDIKNWGTLDNLGIIARGQVTACIVMALVSMQTPLLLATVNITTPLLIAGTVTLGGTDLAGTYNTHTHSGVMAGDDSTDVPDKQLGSATPDFTPADPPAGVGA